MNRFDKVFADTQKFLFENHSNYLKLIKSVKTYLHDRIIPLRSSTEAVFFVYSRKDYPGQSGEIKDINRLTDKIVKFKENFSDWQNKSAIDIHDIVACRVLVYYRSQISLVVEEIERSAETCGFSVVYKAFRDKLGYYAYHLILRCNRLDLTNLLCEVQIKTLLHDAWSCKTHDFIYRPPNTLSSHAKRLMQSMGDSIQALEVQSETLRLMVNREWMFEKKLRRAARLAMLDRLAEKEFADPNLTQYYRDIHGRIIKASDIVTSCSVEDVTLNMIVSDIKGIRQQNGLEPAFQLMLLLASIREGDDLNRMARQYLEDWITDTRKQGSEAAFWRSSALYTIGERDNAVSAIRAYLSEPPGSTESDGPIIWRLKFNLLNYLIEEAMQTETSQFQNECEKLRSELNLDSIESAHKDYSAVQDTLGAYLIAFAQSENDIEGGITKCRNAYDSTATDKAGVAFQKLHERMGWSKLLKSEFGNTLSS